MWIYKITNIQNNKVYIGQTIRPIEQRFNRHINDALNNVLDTHFARAIRYYGKENFRPMLHLVYLNPHVFTSFSAHCLLFHRSH